MATKPISKLPERTGIPGVGVPKSTDPALNMLFQQLREGLGKLIGMERRISVLEGDAVAVESTGSGVTDSGTGSDSDAAIANGYSHTQSIADTVWTVTHELGYYPAGVYAEDAAGDELDGDVEYVSTSRLTITFTTAVAGLARVS